MNSVGFILEASSLSGGVRIIFEYANRLHARGWKVHFYSLGPRPDWFDLEDMNWMRFANYQDMIKFLSTDHKDVKKVATWWRTAKVLNEVKSVKELGTGYYLVQDIETSYYYRPFECEDVARTYDFGFKMFTCNPWVTTLVNMPCVGQAYDAKTFHKVKYEYPAVRTVLAFMRRQALKGFSQLGEFSRLLKVKDQKAELVTVGVDGGIQLLGAHVTHLCKPNDEQMNGLYNRSGCFVSSSLHEGFSLTLLEAMACGTPVSCFNAEGNMSFCVDGENSLVAPKGDVETLSENVIRIFKDDVLRKKLIAGGFETARKYADWDGVIDKLETVLT